MRKLALLIGTAAAVCMASGSSWAVVDNTVFVDPETGTDTGNTTCGQAGTGISTGPCATLNVALANLPSTGGTVVIEKAGTFGPIYITAPLTIVGPTDGQVSIDFQAATLPGCINGAPGSCNSSASATYAVDIKALTNSTVKFKNVIISANGGSVAALHLNTLFSVALTNVALRCGPGSTPLETMLVDSAQGSQIQIYLHNSDVGFCNNGGGIVLAPTGATQVTMNSNHSEVHNATFGLQANSSGLTGTANIHVLLDDTQFFSFNNSAVSVLAGTNGAAVSLTRSSITNTGGAGFKANGAAAGGILYESAIIGNATGVNLLNGATVFTYQNNEILLNGTNCAVNSAPTSCPGTLTDQTPY